MSDLQNNQNYNYNHILRMPDLNVTFTNGTAMDVLNLTGEDISATSIVVTGSITASAFYGDGSQLTGITFSSSAWNNLTADNVSASGTVLVGTLKISGNTTATGTVIVIGNITSSAYAGSSVTAGNLTTTAVGCLIKKVDQVVASGGWVVSTWSSATYDSNSFFSSATNTRITIPSGYNGLYFVNAFIPTKDNTNGDERGTEFRKNGTAFATQFARQDGSGRWMNNLSAIVSLASGDYLEAFVFQDTIVTTYGNNGNSDAFFNATFLGKSP